MKFPSIFLLIIFVFSILCSVPKADAVEQTKFQKYAALTSLCLNAAISLIAYIMMLSDDADKKDGTPVPVFFALGNFFAFNAYVSWIAYKFNCQKILKIGTDVKLVA